MRRWAMAVALGGVLALGSSPGPSTTPVGTDVALRAMVTPSGPATLASAAAISDSLETGIRLVRVRIVDSLDLGITLVGESGITLAEPPVLCLYWIDAAPDDAGLESPCWGTPDPSSELAALLARDDGTWGLDPAQGVAVHARMARGGGRCDYPPGTWMLRVTMVPVVDGAAGERLYVETPFEVAYDPYQVPARLSLGETLFCGLASEVVVEQGVPPTATP